METVEYIPSEDASALRQEQNRVVQESKPSKVGGTIEELLEMSFEQLRALTPDEVEAYIRPALEKQEAIFSAMPAPRGPQTVIMKGRGSNAVATAVMEEAMKNHGITPDMLAKFGIKLKK